MGIWDTWIKKRVFFQLRNGRAYSGKVLEIDEIGNGLTFILIEDKKGMKVGFFANEIAVIQEEEERNG